MRYTIVIMNIIRLHNTLTGKDEVFAPINPDLVTMYNCGPTVYDYVHLGNLRAYVFADVLRRMLEANGYKVKQVMNITDIGHLSGDGDEGEDKMSKGLKREGKPFTLEAMREMAEFYANAFKQDVKDLNIEPAEVMPYASDYIKEEIDVIKKLDEKGFAYVTSDGVYFDTSKDAHYGKLGGLTPIEEEHTRIGLNSEKRSPRDFALWKFNKALGYESPWGNGFPGWHIECSAMSMKNLGDTFDIHTGGVDHIPVHHNNEIAQSENATGKPYANYWLHNAFLNVDGAKMAKSEGNFLRLASLKEKGVSPIGYRYWLLGARYSAQMQLSFEAIEAAEQGYKRLLEQLIDMPDGGAADEGKWQEFLSYINNDLDTPRCIALLFAILKDATMTPADKKATIIKCDTVLGLDIEGRLAKMKVLDSDIDDKTKELLQKRQDARLAKEWATSDSIRAEIAEAGFGIKDTPGGQMLYKL